MQVALVNPNFQARTRGISQTTVGPPLGLAYLAAGARAWGHSVRIVDANVLGLDAAQAADAALDGAPDLVGLTATTPTLHDAADIVRAVRRRHPSTCIALGGPHATALPARTLAEIPELDAVACGEAELSFPALLDALASGDPAAVSAVPGFVWRRPDSSIFDSGPAAAVADLDALPLPARDLLPMNLYRTVDDDRFSTLLAMRGCPCPCVYCSVPALFGRRVRYRKPSAVVEEMKLLVERYGCRFLSFLDDTFTTRKAWVHEFCDAVRAARLEREVRWSCLTRADMVDHSLLAHMKLAGCARVEMSIETGSAVGRAFIRKGLTEAAVLRGYEAAHNVGLSTMAFLILNVPGETEQDIEASLDLVLRADPDFLQVSYLTPYPGTPLYDEAGREGWVRSEDWSRYSFLNAAVMNSGTLTPEALDAARKRLLRRFWLRPRTALKLARLVARGVARPRALARTVGLGVLGLLAGGG